MEKYRGKVGPKRERCISYWDVDIWPCGSATGHDGGEDGEDGDMEDDGCGEMKVLCESARNAELTRAKGFVEGVEEAVFGFRA